jgi:hypothetical protein
MNEQDGLLRRKQEYPQCVLDHAQIEPHRVICQRHRLVFQESQNNLPVDAKPGKQMARGALLSSSPLSRRSQSAGMSPAFFIKQHLEILLPIDRFQSLLLVLVCVRVCSIASLRSSSTSLSWAVPRKLCALVRELSGCIRCTWYRACGYSEWTLLAYTCGLTRGERQKAFVTVFDQPLVPTLPALLNRVIPLSWCVRCLRVLMLGRRWISSSSIQK